MCTKSEKFVLFVIVLRGDDIRRMYFVQAPHPIGAYFLLSSHSQHSAPNQIAPHHNPARLAIRPVYHHGSDRKSTRLNSSHWE